MSPGLRSALVVLTVLFPLAAAPPGKRRPAELQDFYIVRLAVSDASPFWFDYILDVSSQDNGTAIRYIRIAPLNDWCPERVTVKAATAQITGKSPQELAGARNPCLLSPSGFERALNNSRVHYRPTLFDTARWNIVARCGATEKIFHFPYPEEIDMERLKKQSPQVLALWDLGSDLAKEVFGDKSVFYDISEERDLELQGLGEALVPELRSGRFDKGFWGYCSPFKTGRQDSKGKPCPSHPLETLLASYRWPIQNKKASPKLVNAQELHFLNFELPEYPPLAIMAQIQGAVVLTVTVDEDGVVKDASTIWGQPLLAKSALAAAKNWRFDPKMQDTNHPIRVVLEYVFTCP